MGEGEEAKHIETEFDSSVATLQRIDSLIKQLHQCSFTGMKVLYIRTLERLYVEGRAKFSKDEREKCEEYINGLGKIYREVGNDLLKPTKSDGTGKKTNNPQFNQAWSKVISYANEYELHLMESLDNHNMLLKTAKAGVGKFRRK